MPIRIIKKYCREKLFSLLLSLIHLPFSVLCRRSKGLVEKFQFYVPPFTRTLLEFIDFSHALRVLTTLETLETLIHVMTKGSEKLFGVSNEGEQRKTSHSALDVPQNSYVIKKEKESSERFDYLTFVF